MSVPSGDAMAFSSTLQGWSVEPCPGLEEWSQDISTDQDWLALSIPSNDLGFDSLFFDDSSQSFRNPEQLCPPTIFSSSWSPGLESLFMQSLPDHHMALPNSLILSSKEHDALGHYQTAFSIYRTTKDPKWSTHKLLLDLGSQNPMIMHFILAVSINDVCLRREQDSSQDAQQHFEAGSKALIEAIDKGSENDNVFIMAAFLFLYLYMPKRESVPRHRIRHLSMTVSNYLKQNKLDNRCLESSSAPAPPGDLPRLSSRDRSILARLIIWTYDEDVKCGFEGSGGYLAEYLTAHRERTMAVYEVSRTALEAYWGSKYPECQISDDDDNAMELEFLWALTGLWQDINELEQEFVLDNTAVRRRIEQRFSLLEKVSETAELV